MTALAMRNMIENRLDAGLFEDGALCLGLSLGGNDDGNVMVEVY